MTFEKAPEEMTNHLRPLYIRAHIDGKAVSTVLVDNASLVGGSRAEDEPTKESYQKGKQKLHLRKERSQKSPITNTNSF